jgi:hypothetical protein
MCGKIPSGSVLPLFPTRPKSAVFPERPAPFSIITPVLCAGNIDRGGTLVLVAKTSDPLFPFVINNLAEFTGRNKAWHGPC